MMKSILLFSNLKFNDDYTKIRNELVLDKVVTISNDEKLINLKICECIEDLLCSMDSDQISEMSYRHELSINEVTDTMDNNYLTLFTSIELDDEIVHSMSISSNDDLDNYIMILVIVIDTSSF